MTAAIHSPFGRPVHVFMVGRDRERGHKAKCATKEDETIYQAVGLMKAAHLFLCGTSKDKYGYMDPNKWLIFAYDTVLTHRDLAIPPTPYV